MVLGVSIWAKALPVLYIEDEEDDNFFLIVFLLFWYRA